MHPLMHPSTHASIHSSTHAPIHSCIHPLIHSCTHQIMHKSNGATTKPPTCRPLIDQLIHAPTQLLPNSISLLPSHPRPHSFAHPSTHTYTPVQPCIHAPIHSHSPTQRRTSFHSPVCLEGRLADEAIRVRNTMLQRGCTTLSCHTTIFLFVFLALLNLRVFDTIFQKIFPIEGVVF